MQEEKKATEETIEQELSLNDDRRVKVLSPGALVAKRFFRNRLAVVGLTMLVVMFVFSFIGGLISPYGQDEQFYTYTHMDKEYVGVVKNNDLRYTINDGQEFGSILQAQLMLAIGKNAESFEYKDVTYEVEKEGEDLYLISSNGTVLAIAAKDIVNAADGAEASTLTFAVKHEALKAYANGEASFTADGQDYTMDADGNILSGGDEIGYVSRFVVQAKENGVVISRDFKEKLADAIDSDTKEFVYTDADGEEYTYTITYKPDSKTWSVLQSKETYVYDRYAGPSKAHWLGTDTNGMDMLTRLMYGGRVSLVIGFIVVFISAFLGILLGGIAGYFGKWVDNLIMRIVDIFYCIPSTPLIIILGAAMDAMQLDPQIRMLYLMLVLGFLGWPSIARLVRGQILSLREQEFMTAAEACGIRASKRIFRSPSAAGLRIRARSSARPTAPKARLPASAVSSRVINRPSLPNSSGWPTQAASQPTPTAATVPAAAHSPPHSGARRGAGRGCSDCTGCCCCSRRSNTRRSGTNRLHRAAVRAKPSTTAAAKAKRSITQTLHFAK